MHISIITPSRNQLNYLKQCVASVADQSGSLSGKRTDDISHERSNASFAKDPEIKQASLPHERAADLLSNPERGSIRMDATMPEKSLRVHHHIQDGDSTDGSCDFLKEFRSKVADQTSEEVSGRYRFSFTCVADTGMYDALNQGVTQAFHSNENEPIVVNKNSTNQQIKTPANPHQSIVAWLNCDEQYLPGTLEKVAEYFRHHPDVDIVFGDYLIVDEEGELLAFRKGCQPRLAYIQASHLNNLSCAMFFRSEVFNELGGFDVKYKAVADEDFVVRALKAGFVARHVRGYFSTFTFTGKNLGGTESAEVECRKLKREAPRPVQCFRVLLNFMRRLEKFFSGIYRQKLPLNYTIYMNGTERRTFSARQVDWRWPEPDNQKPNAKCPDSI